MTLMVERHLSQRKRHGAHQKQTKHFLKVYYPYLPLLAIVISGVLLSLPWQPRGVSRGVLAYATNTSVSGLLQETNSRRAANGKKTLTLNSQLNAAAQAKAQDMANRNYWSHTTPDGQSPWVFVSQAGYQYQKAGENLAYGFATSADTVSGWMNSPSHKDNMLDAAFSDVGFGIVNAADYQNSGPQTIVVALYGQPKTLAASNTQPSTTKTPAASGRRAQTAQPSVPAPSPGSITPQSAAHAEVLTSLNESRFEPAAKAVSRLQTVTAGRLPWISYAVGMLSGIAIAALVIKHGISIHRMLRRGEQFIFHHPLLDVTIVAFVALCYIANSSAGIIR